MRCVEERVCDFFFIFYFFAIINENAKSNKKCHGLT